MAERLIKLFRCNVLRYIAIDEFCIKKRLRELYVEIDTNNIMSIIVIYCLPCLCFYGNLILKNVKIFNPLNIFNTFYKDLKLNYLLKAILNIGSNDNNNRTIYMSEERLEKIKLVVKKKIINNKIDKLQIIYDFMLKYDNIAYIINSFI